MHRHGYKGRKLHRERDQRSALIKGLADAVVEHESIETTLPKAKEVTSYLEKTITKAKKGDLHSRRQVISSMATLKNAHKLVDDIAPKLKNRTSGYLRIEKSDMRRGDNAQMARVSFVDDLKEAPKKAEEPKVAKAAPVAKKKPAVKAKKEAVAK